MCESKKCVFKCNKAKSGSLTTATRKRNSALTSYTVAKTPKGVWFNSLLSRVLCLIPTCRVLPWIFFATVKNPCSSPTLLRSLGFLLALLQKWIVCAAELRSPVACVFGISPNLKLRENCRAADLPVPSADSVSQGPRMQKAIWVNLCKHTGEAGKMFRSMSGGQTLAGKHLEWHLKWLL